MPYVTMMAESQALQPALSKKVLDFVSKLQKDDTLPGLHIEPLHNVSDPRVRTGRVDQAYRAVLFRLEGSDAIPHYVYMGTWHHDEAIKLAKTKVLHVNPVNGVAELVGASAPVAAPSSWHQPPDTFSAANTDVDTPPPPAIADTQPPLQSFSIEELEQDLGLDHDLAQSALAAADETALLLLLQDAVAWQASALLELATGASIESVRQSLDLEPYRPDPTVSEDERTIQALKHPAAKLSFTFIESDDELRQVIEEGTFGAWRVFLHPEQSRYAERNYKGPFRLAGGAGTGKTVVILHRANALAKQNPAAKIVITTFTKNLAEAIRRDLVRLNPSITLAARLGDPGVWVVGIDALARGVLTSASEVAEAVERVLGERTSAVTGVTKNGAWKDALEVADAELPESLRSEGFFQDEYDLVILPNKVTTRETYLAVRRPGRRVALDRSKRAEVWKVVDAYRRQARTDGTVDYSEVSAVAAEVLDIEALDNRPRKADHVLVDEGQDLLPAKWQFLRALATSGANDLFIAEDSHQRIYGRRIVLSRYGISIVGRSQRLRLNYRTTAENLRLGVGILAGAVYSDLEDAREQSSDYRSSRSGPAPQLIAAKSRGEELDKVAVQLKSWLGEDGIDPATIAVLVSSNKQRDDLVAAMSERGVKIKGVSNDNSVDGVPSAMTIHRAKGMEFAKVLITGMSDGSFPNKFMLASASVEEREDVLLQQRSLLYVAATRARDELAISYSGQPSQLLPAEVLSPATHG